MKWSLNEPWWRSLQSTLLYRDEEHKKDHITHVKDFTDRGDVGEEDEGAMQRHKPQWAPFFRADMIDYLTGVLIRSQQHPINLWCDVEQYISPGPCPGRWLRLLMRVLWWKDEERSIQPQGYRMRVHLFGTVSPPVCATQGLKSLARENTDSHPQSS